MDAQLKAKWVEALRSGEYAQGRIVLRDPEDAFCCLGILCHISGDGEWHIDRGEYEYRVGASSTVSLLPFAIQHKYDIQVRYVSTLIVMNDGGSPFSEIADYIEQNL